MERPHYKRLLAEAEFREHMLRRDLARYSAVPLWLVTLCDWARKMKRAVA